MISASHATTLADSILALQRARSEAADPDTESLALLVKLAREMLPEGTKTAIEKEAWTLWKEAVDRVSGEAVKAEKLNDADMLGSETEGFTAFIEKEATLLLGELWGAKDRRNTQDGDWNPVTMPWAAWVVGGPGDKNTAPWGFSRHPENKSKAGACIVLGSSIGKARKAKAMDTMYAMGLDVDAGYPLDSMLDRLEDLGRFCIVYTTHSHGKAGLHLKHDEVIRKLKIKPSELDLAQVQR
ncbi:hypothetical protein IQ03_01662 [Gemmobacter caeni]|uniref:Uncharacterized protein n=1 Tax=Gemmobacter caeni TaxID=589035 RepID=A0A2T6B209_9RHOB|nr:hypothetical protein [Gemmobacter caeni]PTX50116.1 hypothetical protein C8N34_106298 [Gemmobacter caeni]TWJ02010.1 hypothetical protein IQ03_01662 [Gemmobacter caeni]